MLVGFAKRDGEEIPTFKTLEQWDALKSTKMDACARICRHLLSRDDAPAIIFKDGEAIFPTIPPHQQSRTRIYQETKILIYQEFTSLGPLLLNVSIRPFLFS
jgi:hypothetical protein